MTGYELFKWLQEIPKDELRKCKVWLEVPGIDHERLITAKIYDQNRDGKRDTIYLIHK